MQMKKDLITIANVTLKILSKKSWNLLTVSDVKKNSKIKEFDKLIDKKKSLLRNINNYFDYLLLLQIKEIDDSNQKDMIFEIFMLRFDILENNRKAINSIFISFKKKPKELFFLLPSLLDSIILMAKYSNISNKGFVGQIRMKGLLIIYCATFFTWINDNNSSLEKTMTTLDQYLNQAENIVKFIK
tara:strand:- start:2432 stop:2989 length:558 start_codon:yes stop_codon:yes gene_type:complete